MYGIYANIWGILMVNVTIYSIHGSYWGSPVRGLLGGRSLHKVHTVPTLLSCSETRGLNTNYFRTWWTARPSLNHGYLIAGLWARLNQSATIFGDGPRMRRVPDVPISLPSGNLLQFAIENDHRNSGFSHSTWWFSIVMCTCTRG